RRRSISGRWCRLRRAEPPRGGRDDRPPTWQHEPMAKDIFQQRETYLEEEYFRKKEFELLEKLKKVFQKKMDKEAIRKATGVRNEQLLDRLVEIQLNGEMMKAFELYPLVEIAWADGDLSESEARSVLAAGEKRGIAPGSRGYQMLDDRLHKGPDPELRKV